MAKIIDITEKLDFDGNPKLKIKDTELEVNSDATTVLKIMGVLGENTEPGPKEVLEMYNLIFSKEERAKIDKLKLNFKGFQTVVFSAIGLITGDNDQGEQ